LLDRLCAEFRQELRELGADTVELREATSTLDERVVALEQPQSRVGVAGWLDCRLGMVGEELGLHREFDALSATISVTGDITDHAFGKLTLKARDTLAPNDAYGAGALWLDEAYVRFRADRLGILTIGRQRPRYGMGLVVDADRQALQGVRGEFPGLAGGLGLEFFAGTGGEVDEGAGLLAGVSNDGYLSVRLAWLRPGLQLGANALLSGISQPNAHSYEGPYRGGPHPGRVNDESAGSVDLLASVWGRTIRAEYAVIAEHANRPVMPRRPGAPSSARRPSALVASAELLRTEQFSLTGFYSTADPGYDIYYSAINPYYEVLYGGGTPGSFIPFERWLRRPPVLSNVRVIGGSIRFEAADTDLEIVYYVLDDNAGPGNWWNPYNPNLRAGQVSYDLTGLYYDTLYAFIATHRLSPGLNLQVTYAHQEPRSPGYGELDLLQAAMAVGF